MHRAVRWTLGLLLLVGGCAPPGESPPPPPVDGGTESSPPDGGTAKADVPPRPPGQVSAQPGTESVTVRWAGSPDEVRSYSLRWGRSPDTLTGRADGLWGTSFTVKDLPGDVPHVFAVEAVGATTGNGVLRSELSPFARATPLPRALTVTNSSPGSGSTGWPTNDELAFSFSERVDPASVRLSITPEHPLTAPTLTESGGNTYLRVFPERAFAAYTEYTVTLEARARSGRELPAPYRLRFSTGAGATTAPRVTRVLPSNEQTGVGTSAPVSLDFNLAMDRASVESALRFTPAVTCAFSWTSDNRTLRCQPSTPLSQETDYQLELGASARAAGEGGSYLGHPFRSGFRTTGPDRVPPRLQAFSPAHDERGVAPSIDIELTFSEAMNCDSLTAAFRIVSPSRYAGGTLTCSYERATYTPPTPWTYGDTVVWEVGAEARDSAGNALGTAQQHSFRAARAATQVLSGMPGLDGTATRSGTVNASGTSLTVGASPEGPIHNGFLAFNLAALPLEALRIGAATLTVTQLETQGDPFSKLGSVYAQSVYYGPELDWADMAASPDTYTQCSFFTCTTYYETVELSLSSAPGPRAAVVTREVSSDFASRGWRGHLAQFRLVPARPGDADGGTDLVRFSTSEASLGGPTLEVQYEYP